MAMAPPPAASNPPHTWNGLLRSVDDTLALARLIARHTAPGDLIALLGQLGAGKTQFVRGLAQGLGIDDDTVSSPTFVIVQEYTDPEKPNAPVLIHIDAYRIHSLDELESIGCDDLLSPRPGPRAHETASGDQPQPPIVVIEWADRLEGHLPNDRLVVELSHATDHHRAVKVTPYGSWIPRMQAMAAALQPFASATPSKPPPAKPRVDKCPICRKPVTEDRDPFPFCSQRCRQVDLSRWLGEKYLISRPIEASDWDET